MKTRQARLYRDGIFITCKKLLTLIGMNV